MMSAVDPTALTLSTSFNAITAGTADDGGEREDAAAPEWWDERCGGAADL